MLPSVVFTQRNGVQLAALLPDPTAIATCVQPAFSTAGQQDRPSLTVILVSVGTFVRGFDELVSAADAACAELCLAGFAQIGHSSVAPRHMDWARFVPEAELRAL